MNTGKFMDTTENVKDTQCISRKRLNRRPASMPPRRLPISNAVVIPPKNARPRSGNYHALRSAVKQKQQTGQRCSTALVASPIIEQLYSMRTTRGLLDFSRMLSRKQYEVAHKQGQQRYIDATYDIQKSADACYKHVPSCIIHPLSPQDTANSEPSSPAMDVCSMEATASCGPTPQALVATGIVPMDKVSSRVQRAKLQRHRGEALFDPNIPYYCGQPVQRHTPVPHMDGGAPRLLDLGAKLSDGQQTFYDCKYTQVKVPEGKGVVPFDSYVSREKASMGHTTYPGTKRDLDIPLRPSYSLSQRRSPDVLMAKQLARGAYRKLGRNVDPHRHTHYKDEVLLRPKFTMVDRKVTCGVSFAKTIGRDKDALQVNQRRTRVHHQGPEIDDIHCLFGTMRPRVKGYVSMATQTSRYDRPASKFALLRENEAVKRTMYYTPEDKFSLNQYVVQEGMEDAFEEEEYEEEEEEEEFFSDTASYG